MLSRELETYIVNNFRQRNQGLCDDLYDLFKEFSKTEVECFEDFKNLPEKFGKFVISCSDLLGKFGECVPQDKLIRAAFLVKRMINNHINDRINSFDQQSFVWLVEDLLGSTHKSVLDVGPGLIPYSSILFGKDFDKVDAMDKYFWVSDEALKKLNVNAHSNYLTKDTSVDDIDIIVGRMPCSAIDTIVYLSTKYDKKYFIQTCDCEMPSPDMFYKKWGIDKTSKVSHSNIEGFGWSTMLPELDKDICFCGEYAFNLGNNVDCKDFLLKKLNANKTNKISSDLNNVSYTSINGENIKGISVTDEKELD